MTDVPWALRAKSGTRRRNSALARTAFAPVLCCLGVAVVLGATLLPAVASVPPAGADQVTDLQAQAQQLSQEMILEQLQIDAFEQQRAADMAAAAADETELRAIQTQLAMTSARVANDLRELRSAAVKDYVDGGTEADGTSSMFASSASDGPGAVYAQVMTGNLNAVVDQLSSDRQALRTEEATQTQIAAEAAQQAAQANEMLANAQATESTLALQHAETTSELAAAISQEQALAAASASAAASAPAQAVPNASAPAPASSGTGSLPVLNAFLTCVVQAESSGDYKAVSPTGQYMGAFQFSQPTWNEAAQLAGLPQLIGVAPNDASPRDQDLLAIALYDADGEQPWYDPCRS